jgi:cyanophycinase
MAKAGSNRNGNGRSHGNGSNGRHAVSGRNGLARAARQAERFRARPLRPSELEQRTRGQLVIIGGHEDKKEEKLILRYLAERVGSGALVVSAVASSEPDEMWRDYESVFRGLGVRHVRRLSIESRADAESAKSLRVLQDATAVFLTGGDQLRITSMVGDTPVYSRILEIYQNGGTIAGTSAGASVMSETMLVRGGQNGSHRIGPDLQLAPGFGFAKDMVIDQHFAERGRVGRLFGVVAQNPRILGIGIDENTAIVLNGTTDFRVIGESAVYVVDGSSVTETNIAEGERDRAMSLYHATVHVLTQGDEFKIATRTPIAGAADRVEAELGLKGHLSS